MKTRLGNVAQPVGTIERPGRKVDEPSTYLVLITMKAVLVKVPTCGDKKNDGSGCKYMKEEPAHSFQTSSGEVNVPAHYKHGQPIPGGIMYRHFFGLADQDFGKRIIATVEVVEKTTADGKKYILLNITKTKEPNTTWASYKINFVEIPNKTGGDIYIPRSGNYLHFKKLPSKEEITAAKQTSPTAQPSNMD
ncbi:MAG: hypothetical protein NTZ49_04975 [Candidatus Parcubacteria bacterium]|nr:hypothetical protein [Candidatus Parcubacteria bacterium]